MTGQAGAREQVGRLLTLVPYLHSRGQVTLGEAARVLDVPPAQVVKDLKVLFMVGLPDGYPDDLIDVDLDALEGPDADGVIRVSNADYLARPLRLTATEATAVMVALLALRGGASDDTREVVDRALAKLQSATLGDAPAAAIDPGTEQPGVAAGLRDELERAVREGRQVRLTYWVPSRDEETERVVDPRRVVSNGGATYLDAWCHSAEDDRLFRLDRIHAAAVLDTRVDPSVVADGRTGEDLFDFAAGGERVTIELDPPARWVVEYHPVEETRELPDGRVAADLMVADRRWLARLLLRLAPYARVAAPEALHREFTGRARETLGLYRSGRVQ
ncbi:helix-turn-helix transcriptional regulator [Nocardioides sp. GXQ0305]|uniref:helix-turn-helix transcriptional regulator n=1 Tax=Nocardioides sp. GXQ0305 TaxID=3423912 RepID=UPI003D7E475A